jgi:hypothetical protein
VSDTLDLGSGHVLTFHAWSPDRALNPQFEGIPDVERYGATISHRTPDGRECMGGVTFAGASQRALDSRPGARAQATWTVESWEPLTLSPSILCHCGDHGYIRDGRWISA